MAPDLNKSLSCRTHNVLHSISILLTHLMSLCKFFRHQTHSDIFDSIQKWKNSCEIPSANDWCPSCASIIVPLTFRESQVSFWAVVVWTWSSLRKKRALFPQEEGEGGPNLRVVEEGCEVQPGKRARELRERLVKQRSHRSLAVWFLNLPLFSVVKVKVVKCDLCRNNWKGRLFFFFFLLN